MSITYTTNSLGDITFDGFPLIHLTDQAVTDMVYPEAGASYVRYVAPGKDEKGNKYLVYWSTTKEWEEHAEELSFDEEYACEWDNPVEVVER